MTPKAAAAMVRPLAARALSWALLLGGWVGIASVSRPYVAGPAASMALLALWLLALGGSAVLLVRLRPGPALLRSILAASAVTVAASLWATLHSGQPAWLLACAPAWALLVTAASASLETSRHHAGHRAGLLPRPLPPPLPRPACLAAALGALAAWAVLGDVGDVATLVPRLAWGVLAAGLCLALLHPRSGASAGRLDCALPHHAPVAWPHAQRLPLTLATLTMLPMMCSLWLMADLCRGGFASPQSMLGLHFAAMFAPALLLGLWAPRPDAARCATACATLLVLGAAALLLLPEGLAWSALALAHGGAWSVAWHCRPGRAAPGSTRHGRAPRMAMVQAGFACALGLALGWVGPSALAALHLALGAGGLLALRHARARAPVPMVGRLQGWAGAAEPSPAARMAVASAPSVATAASIRASHG